VWFWRDASANMDFKSGPKEKSVSKRQRADLLLLSLASLLVRGGERVGFIGMEGNASASRLALTRIGRALFAPGEAALPPPAKVARGNQLVWFSDFLDAGVEDAMTALSRQGVAGHLVRIVDPAEEEFPYTGRTRFESPLGESDEIFGRAERIRSPYRARFAAHGEAVAQNAARLGWTSTVHRTDHAPQASLIALHAAIGGG
jgi:uncharacterized protein (DUF58 family)